MSFRNDVTAPRRVIDAGTESTKPKPLAPNTAEYWRDAATGARAKREYIEETAMARSIADPPLPPEPAFQVKGSVNLGEIDIQEQQRLASEAAERARKEAQERVTKAELERDDARDAFQQAQIAHLHADLGGRIEALQSAAANNNKAGIAEQLQGVIQVAGMLGLEKPDPGPADGSLALEIKKIELQMKKEDRDFQRLMKQDERAWQIELKKLEQASREAEARLHADREKYASFANMPERFGSVVASALMERSSDGAEMGPALSGKKSGGSKHSATAAPGESGQLECPDCNAPIGVGPTTRIAECANCHTKVSIKREAGASAAAPITNVFDEYVPEGYVPEEEAE